MTKKVLCLAVLAQFALTVAIGQPTNIKTRRYGIPADKHHQDAQATNIDQPIPAELLVGFNEDSVRAVCRQKQTADWETDLHVKVLKREYAARKLATGRYAPGSGLGEVPEVTVMPPCTNLDFETGDFTGWNGFIGDNDVMSGGPLSNLQAGIFSTTQNAPVSDPNARHTIMTAAGGTDPCGGFPVVAPGGQYSVRLGGETPNYQAEVLEQTFTVSPSSTNITYQYAVILNDGGHAPADQPYFKIEVLDANGNVIDTCVQYYVAAGLSIPGFQTCSNNASSMYKPWTTISIDLSAQVNQNVTIRFTVAGCTQSGHYGYAYIDCACSALSVALHFCPGNPTVVLNGPAGYSAYQWYDGSGNPIPGANTQNYTITNAVVGTSYSVHMTAITGCVTVLNFTLQYTDIYSPITVQNIDCWGDNNGQLTTAGNTGVPPYQYSWSNGANTPVISNLPPGQYIVTTTDSLGCQVKDTAIVVEPPRLDTSAIVYNFCPGDPAVTFTAPPGYTNYTWYNGDMNNSANIIAGATTNTVIITSPTLGQQISCVYQTPPGCKIYDSIFVALIPPGIVYNPDSLTNVFTPNGDFKNDLFFPFYDYTLKTGTYAAPVGAEPTFDFTKMYIGTYELHVYDRWGMEVFESNAVDFGWDGKVNSNKKEATPGVYYWIAKMTSRCKEDQTPTEVTGFVHLIRDKDN